jgi:hypothetical protein
MSQLEIRATPKLSKDLSFKDFVNHDNSDSEQKSPRKDIKFDRWKYYPTVRS